MNLHAVVRGAISAVNPDRLVTWRQNGTPTTDAAGKRTPTYTDVEVGAQVQELTGRDLKHEAFQNLQTVGRSVYLFGNVQGVVRREAKGGDMLMFPEVIGGAPQSWLVVAVFETWTPDAAGWCRVGVVLQ